MSRRACHLPAFGMAGLSQHERKRYPSSRLAEAKSRAKTNPPDKHLVVLAAPGLSHVR